MANVLTGLIRDLYVAIDVVSRYRIGHIQSVSLNATMEQAAKNQTVKVPKTRPAVVNDITPSMTIPEGDNQTVDPGEMKLTKMRGVQIPWEGEEQYAYSFNGTLITTLQDQFIQAFTAINDEVETDIASLYKKASRAYGIAGTTPFASSLIDAARVEQILNNNGAPAGIRSIVFDDEARVNMLNLSNLNTVNQSGTDATLRDGILLNVNGFSVRDSSKIPTHTKGTGSSYVTNVAVPPLAIGTTTINIDTGTGTVLAGDVVTFAGDTNKYIVTTGVAAPGDIVIAAPGLKQTLADGVAMTIGDSYTANMAYSRNAIQLATRPPKSPVLNGQSVSQAIDIELFTDTWSGITYLISAYPGYHKMMIEIALVWGFEMIKPEHSALLLG